MDSDTFKQNVRQSLKQRNIFLFLTLIQAIALVILSSIVCVRKERLVVVPTTGTSYWIEDNKVSQSYVEKMGIYLSDLLLNRTPSDVEKKNKLILEHVHPAFYQKIRKQLFEEQAGMLKTNQSYFFRTEHSYALPKELSFIAEGEFLVLVNKSGDIPICAQNELKKYVLKFQCENGKLLLTSFKKDTFL